MLFLPTPFPPPPPTADREGERSPTPNPSPFGEGNETTPPPEWGEVGRGAEQRGGLGVGKKSFQRNKTSLAKLCV